MSLRLVFRPQAREEPHRAREWYEACRTGLGEVFIASVERVVERIEEHPLAYPRARGEMRRALVPRFPHAVLFQLVDDGIVVLGVVHGHRHARSWPSRE